MPKLNINRQDENESVSRLADAYEEQFPYETSQAELDEFFGRTDPIADKRAYFEKLAAANTEPSVIEDTSKVDPNDPYAYIPEPVTSSFNNLDPLFGGKRKESKRKMILRSIVIDNKNIRRKRIPYMPSMCLKPNCNYDAAIAAKFNGWQRVPPSHRPAVLRTLEDHVKLVHSTAEEVLVEEDQLPIHYLNSMTVF